MQQSASEVIVVDYGCEHGTAEWVSQYYPAAKIVEVKDDPSFCASRARNIGARYATQPLLAFVDADIMLNRDLREWIRTPPTEPLYFAPLEGTWEIGGFIVCTKEAFHQVDGYDEAFRGWGHEDTDFAQRLQEAGYKRAPLPFDLLSAISHGNDERQLGADKGYFDSTEQALFVGELYRRIKSDINHLTGQPIELERRTMLMAKLKDTFKEAWNKNQDEIVVTCSVNASQFKTPRLKVDSDLVYRLNIEHLKTT